MNSFLHMPAIHFFQFCVSPVSFLLSFSYSVLIWIRVINYSSLKTIDIKHMGKAEPSVPTPTRGAPTDYQIIQRLTLFVSAKTKNSFWWARQNKFNSIKTFYLLKNEKLFSSVPSGTSDKIGKISMTKKCFHQRCM